MLELRGPIVFYGERNVNRRMVTIKDRWGFLDEDYDRCNPDGTLYGRRNFNETSYFSGLPDQSPAEYRRDDFDFYRDYGPNQKFPEGVQP